MQRIYLKIVILWYNSVDQLQNLVSPNYFFQKPQKYLTFCYKNFPIFLTPLFYIDQPDFDVKAKKFCCLNFGKKLQFLFTFTMFCICWVNLLHFSDMSGYIYYLLHFDVFFCILKAEIEMYYCEHLILQNLLWNFVYWETLNQMINTHENECCMKQSIIDNFWNDWNIQGDSEFIINIWWRGRE